MTQWRASWKRMENERLMQALGLCAKARALVFGTPMVCEALRQKNKPYLVIEAADNSQNTAKRIADKCTFYEVEHWQIAAGGDALARAVGKQARVAAVAVTDENLCKLLHKVKTEQHN